MHQDISMKGNQPRLEEIRWFLGRFISSSYETTRISLMQHLTLGGMLEYRPSLK